MCFICLIYSCNKSVNFFTYKNIKSISLDPKNTTSGNNVFFNISFMQFSILPSGKEPSLEFPIESVVKEGLEQGLEAEAAGSLPGF